MLTVVCCLITEKGTEWGGEVTTLREGLFVKVGGFCSAAIDCYRLFSSPEWQRLHGEQFSAAFCQRALAL